MFTIRLLAILRNTDDRDVKKFLNFFTDIELIEIEKFGNEKYY